MSVPDIRKPSELLQAIERGLRQAEPGLQVGTRQDFDNTSGQPWLLLDIERNQQAPRSSQGRQAQLLRIVLQLCVPRQAGSAQVTWDLASRLLTVLADNRWGWSAEQCGAAGNIVAQPLPMTDPQPTHDAWSLSFDQAIYLGPALLDDPVGKPLFARTWEVSSIDDPSQYRALED
ncbi:hypothetical protein [Pseudomonas piscis]|uniref:hypothetical protein n=1 Tax=Pseudomonas piscis TaxID=2614538 RepID=UPI0021D56E4A|nr:hypothetical protein [Pseudomonas piscis]MCU7649506.1 hypothetical protein [Pseudomonas piscis]